MLDDPAGNTASSTENGSTTLAFDAVNRLQLNPGPSGTTNFSYDANGNLILV